MITPIPKTVVILGMHRSGTSMIAGVINRLGVNMGEKLLGKSWTNPYGHFEDEDFIQLNMRILEAVGGSWDYPPGDEELSSRKEDFGDEIRDLLRVKNRSKLWGWKDPRTSLTLEFYLPYLINPYFIVAHRNEQDIIRSLERRNDDMTEQYARELIGIYKSRIQNILSKHPDLPVFHVNYEEFLNNPETTVNGIVEFLGLVRDEEDYRQAVLLVRPSDEIRKRSKYMRIQERVIQLFRRPARRLYHFFRKKSSDSV